MKQPGRVWINVSIETIATDSKGPFKRHERQLHDKQCAQK